MRFGRGDIVEYIEEKDKKSNFHYLYKQKGIVLSSQDNEIDSKVQNINIKFLNYPRNSGGYYSTGFKLVKRSPIICKVCPFIEGIIEKLLRNSASRN